MLMGDSKPVWRKLAQLRVMAPGSTRHFATRWRTMAQLSTEWLAPSTRLPTRNGPRQRDCERPDSWL